MVNWQYTCGSGPADDAPEAVRARTEAINEPMWPVFVRVLERAAAHGLLVDVTFTRDTYDAAIPVDAYRTAIAGVAERLLAAGGHRHVLFDVQNEYPIHGLTAADVHGILSAVEAVDPARIVTASGGGGDIVDDPAMDVVAYHDSREDDWHEAGGGASGSSKRSGAGLRRAGKPVYFQEPMPFRKFHPTAVTASGRGPARRGARRAMRGATGAAAWTFHTRQSFDLRSRTLVADSRRPTRTRRPSSKRSAPRSSASVFRAGPHCGRHRHVHARRGAGARRAQTWLARAPHRRQTGRRCS